MAKRATKRRPKPRPPAESDDAACALSGVSNADAEKPLNADLGDVSDADDLTLARSALRALLQDKTASAAARASAARTLAEMAGAIGKNAEPPSRAGKPLAEMSREELERELRAEE